MQDDMTHGGAQYIGTGRGFSLTTSQFLKIWTNYSRSHIYPGVELLSLAFLMVGGRRQGRHRLLPG
jgi:1,3-beta-glucan synthase